MFPAQSRTTPVFALLDADPADYGISLVAVNDAEAAVQIDIRPSAELTPIGGLPAYQHPAMVYLASLANGSHRTMIGSLTQAAAVLTAGQCDYQTCPWWQLRYAHLAALRAHLMQNQSAATGNKVLAAVRGTLRAAWQLGIHPHRRLHARYRRQAHSRRAAGPGRRPGSSRANSRPC